MKLSRPERIVDEAWTVMRAAMDPRRRSVHQLCITVSISAEGSAVTVVLVVTERFAHSSPVIEEKLTASRGREGLVKWAEGEPGHSGIIRGKKYVF